MMKVIVYAAIIAALIIGYAKYIERRSIFFPERNIEVSPQLANLEFADVYFDAQDNLRLNGWFIPQAGARYTLLFCHGNGGNISHRLEKIVLLRQAQVHIFMFDYRGYGRSQGRPTEAGIYRDTQAAYDYLTQQRKIDPGQIILYGESLGCAAAIDLGAKEKVAGLIAEGSFSRGREMGKRIYPFLPSFLFSNSFDSLAKIKRVKAPKLFIHSKNDEIVPYDLAEKLYRAADGPKRMLQFLGGHNTAYIDSREKYVSAISAFIKGLE